MRKFADGSRHHIWCLALGAGLLMLFAADHVLAQGSPFGVPGPRPAPASGITAWLLQQQAQFHRALTSGMRAVASNPAALLSLLGLAFSYGVLHAIGPGHGKAVIASYLVANERAMRRGIGLAFAAAGVQALIAILAVVLILGVLGGKPGEIEQSVNWVERAGLLLIFLLGLAIFWRKLTQLRPVSEGRAAANCAHDHGVDPAVLAGYGRRDLLLTAIGAGIRPCSGALIVLVLALSQGLFWAGALSVGAMAIGTAIGTSLFAILAVKAKAIALRLAAGRGHRLHFLGLWLEAAAGLALALLGLALLTGAMQGGG